MSFSAPSHGAGYFLFRQKVAKDHAPMAVVERTSCSFDCPAMLVERRPNSHVPVLKHAALAPPFGCASRHRQRRVVASMPAIHGLQLFFEVVGVESLQLQGRSHAHAHFVVHHQFGELFAVDQHYARLRSCS